MIMQLGKEYQIVTNSNEFAAQRFITTTTTVENKTVTNTSWKTIGFYPQINQALRCVSKNILLMNDDLDVIINKLNLLDIRIEEIHSLLENTCVKDLVKVIEASDQVKEEFEESEEDY